LGLVEFRAEINMKTLETGNNQKPSGLSLYSRSISEGKLKLLEDYIGVGSVLDLGCGNGLYGLYLASRGCGVVQLDLLDRREPAAQHLPFFAADAQDLRFQDRTFDYVLAFDIMEHLDNDRKFLLDVKSICRKALFLSVPNPEDHQLESVGVTHKHFKDKTHRREYTQEQLVQLLEEMGFELACIRPNYVNFTALPRALARPGFLPRAVAKLFQMQLQLLFSLNLFENRSIGDWYVVAHPRPPVDK
jgi:SAM-dependent methyltransferase